MQAREFRDLMVYQSAFESAAQVYELSERFPVEERYSLTDQLRRSSRSICANIAEAWKKRRYRAAFVSKLSDAEAEAAETQVWLDMALRCGYLDADAHTKLLDHYEHICARLAKMMDSADLWCNSAAHKNARE